MDNKLQKLENLFNTMIFDILELDKYCDIEHLKETPKRMAKMFLQELLTGVYNDPKDLIKEFSLKNPGERNWVCVRNIEVRSLCSHHFMPFYGSCDIVYLPDNKIIGLSKFSRIVDYFSRKPQVQENLTNEIASFIFSNISPLAVGVKIQAVHLCMKHRGVKSNGEMETYRILTSDDSLYYDMTEKILLRS